MMRGKPRLKAAVWGMLAAFLGVFISACGATTAAPSASSGTPASSTTPKTVIRLGFPRCAHCLAMNMLSQFAPGVTFQNSTFANSNDVMTALLGGSLDMAQVTYLNLIGIADQKLPLVAVSGQVNGGSDFILKNGLNIAPNDWTALKRLIAADKQKGTPFSIASNYGAAQDIEIRGELANEGINPNTDVNIINVPFSQMPQALESGQVDAAAAVEPFASDIILNHWGVHFAFPYNQSAGNLTNVVVVRTDFLKAHPQAVQAAVDGLVKLVPYLTTPAGQNQWAKVVEQYTGLPANVVDRSLKGLSPNYHMPYAKIEAIATEMYNLHLVHYQDGPRLPSVIDYQYLEKATGKTAAQLGGP